MPSLVPSRSRQRHQLDPRAAIDSPSPILLHTAKVRAFLPLLSVSLLLRSTSAASALILTNAPAPPAPVPDLSSSIFRVLGALTFVLAFFFAGAWLLKNWQRFAAKNSASSKLRILESKSIGPRQALLVVRYEQNQMLVASSPNGISLVTHLPDAAESDLPPSNSAGADRFPVILQRLFGARS